MSEPKWYTQLQWSRPRPVLTIALTEIPQHTGLYVFTTDDGPLNERNVLYVGKADGARQSLRGRLYGYFRRFARPKPTNHQGKNDLTQHFVTHGQSSLYLRWAVCALPTEVEGGLLHMFDPPYNHQDEHRMLADDESLPYVD